MGLALVLLPKPAVTRAQIVAALPAALRAFPPADPAGEGRYRRVVALGEGIYTPVVARALDPKATDLQRTAGLAVAGPILARLEGALDGTLRVPVRSSMSFPDAARLRALAKLCAFATRETAARREPRCGRYAILGLRLAKGAIGVKGSTTDLLVGIAIEAIAARAVDEADAAGGLDAASRRAVLALMPPLDGRLPEAAGTVRYAFYAERLPILLDPVEGFEDVFGLATKEIEPWAEGFDPLATARLLGPIYAAAMRDSRKPLGARADEAERLADGYAARFPEPKGKSQAAMRREARAIPNLMGKLFATFPPVVVSAEVGALRATRRNLVRAAMLLRYDEGPIPPNPFGKGPLRVDRARRLVWSLGPNGVDDGGMIGQGRGAKAADVGERY